MDDKQIKGYIPSIIEPEHYVLGALSQEVLREDGQWVAILPSEETQIKRTDTWNCTAFGTLNCYEILFFKLWGLTKNFSDRFLGIVAGTFPPGNDPHTVAQAVRHFGLVNETSLPFTDDINTPEKYYAPKPPTAELTAEAQQFLKEYVLGHEWVFTNELGAGQEIERMKQALKYSPLGVSVFAWEQTGELFTNKNKLQDTHWTCIVGYKENEYWIAWDSYAPLLKKLAWNFPFGQVKRYSLRKKTEEEKAAERLAAEKTNFIIAAYKWVISALQFIVDYKKEEQKSLETLKTTPEPPKPVISPETPENAPQPVVVRETMQEMIRRVCKEEKLNQIMSDRLFKTIQCESNFNNDVTHKNISKKTGKVISTDYYLCQINDYYHIGEGKSFPSVQYVHDNPEKVVRWMARLFKQGKANLWVCYSRLFK